MSKITKSGRKRTGTVQWFTRADGSRYMRARIRLADGSRPWLDVPDEHHQSKKAAQGWAAYIQTNEDAKGEILAAKQVPQPVPVAAAPVETCDAWYERYYKYQGELGRTSAVDARYCWTAWIAPSLGPKAIAAVTKRDVEDLRDKLDAAILAWRTQGRGPGRISGKRAMNIWSALTSAMAAATGSKRRELRVFDVNPCMGVEPPGDRESRKARRKPFVYPVEFAKLMACAAVPAEWRELHAIAAYTYMRPNELRALTWGDVDIELGIISVTRAWDSRAGKVKAPKTRNGVRQVPIHANLVPLLRSMRAEDVAADALVLPILDRIPEDDVATYTRGHLLAAGIRRSALHEETGTTTRANFRTWRDSGITWLAMTGLGVDKIMRRAGHDVIGTTMTYVKLAEDVTGTMGEPFPALPVAVLSKQRSNDGAPNALPAELPLDEWCEGRELNAPSAEILPGTSGDSHQASDSRPETGPVNGATVPGLDQAIVQAEGGDVTQASDVSRLAGAIAAASAAGQWDVVRILARQLEAMTLAQAGNVVPIRKGRRSTS